MNKPFIELLHFLRGRLIAPALLEVKHEVVQRLESNQRFAMRQGVLADEAGRLYRLISKSGTLLTMVATHV